MTTVNQKRIAVNTLLLYFRMVIMTFVGLYTSRVIIDSLGQTHFGIYDAVGAIVTMVSFISTTMSSACQRFYSYEMERNGMEELRKVFCISMTVFFILTAIILLLSETAGSWYLVNKMDVNGEIEAAKWVFQFSILSFSLQILRVPYMGMVIAREKMKIFAYLSLFEAFAALGIALFISHTADDKNARLVLYAGLMSGTQIVMYLFYWLYCRLFYRECRFRFMIDKDKFREIFSYAGWNMIGASANVLKSQGINLLLNASFGVIVSAARGIGYKVYSTIAQLNDNFFTAVRPQLYKSFAAGEMKDMHKLICQSTRFSFYLLFLLALPILLETDFILPVWLKGRNVSGYAFILTRLMLIEGLVNCFTNPLATSIQATGNVRNYQIVIGCTLLTILPLSYLGIRYLNWAPSSVFIVSITVTVFAQVLRLLFVRKQVGLDPAAYIKGVFVPIAGVAAISVSISLIIRHAAHLVLHQHIWLRSLSVIGSSMIVLCITAFIIGMTKTERKHILEVITAFLKKIKLRKSYD